MASINLKGYLREPLGETSGGNKIVFTHVSTTGEVIAGSRTSYTVEANGYYDIDIEYGNVAIETSDLNSRSWQYHGTTTINQDTTATTLPTLLNSFVPPTNDQIILFQDLVKDAEDARDASEASAVRSEAAAQDSINNSILMNEQQARAKNATNNNHFDASGMVNTGKHETKNAIVNEGIAAYLNSGSNVAANTILIGASAGASLSGTSKTGYSVNHIAGSVINAILENNQFKFELPPAPDGTQVSDSTGDARGSGKANLDLKVDVDPKYGDVPTGSDAEILREAVSRAFEGYTKNGDMRDGVTSWTAQGGAILSPVADGVELITSASSMGMTGIIAPAAFGAGDEVEVTLVANIPNGLTCVFGVYDSTNGTRTTVATGTGKVEVYKTTISFPNADSGVNIRLYHSGGASVRTITVHNLSLRPATEEVVTHRVDLAAWEYYEEELTGRVEIMECVGSTSTTFGTTSVPTVLSTRKLSYFQQYDGQFPEVTANPDFINDRFVCVVWDDLTEPQKREIAAYMGEKLFMGVNGFPVNGRLRARTIRGAGNGDWTNIDSNTATSNWLQPTSNLLIKPQGKKDASPQASGAFPTYGTQLTVQTSEVDTHKGVFQALSSTNIPDESAAYQGRCFLYVVATVPRACKAAYVKGLNEFGTGMLQSKRGAGFSEVWYASNAVEVNTLQDTFTMLAPNTGAIGQTSGHPDGIFYDGIEAGGLNGIIDWRLPAVANDSPEESAKVEAKVENKTYRGLEELVWTFAGTSTEVGLATGAILDGGIPKVGLTEGSSIFIETSVGNYEERTVTGLNYSLGAVNFTPAATRIAGGHYIVSGVINLSVSGEFATQMVVADPANILLTDALKDGWLGTWCPVIPDGANHDFPMSRKDVGSASVTTITTANNGDTWATNPRSIHATTNDDNASWSTGLIVIYPYKAWAKPTKKSSNKPVYNGKAGLMDVFSTSSSVAEHGVHLQESLTGNIGKSTINPYRYSNKLTAFNIHGSSGVITDNVDYSPEHTPLLLAAPSNDSPAVKVLPYQISNNGQGSIGYQANELTWGTPTYLGVDETNTAWVAGEFYRVQDSTLGTRKFYRCEVSTSLPMNSASFIKQADGSIKYHTTGVIYFTDMGLPQGWGDDDKVKVTADGSDTFVDLNGNTNLSVVHELAIPCTWTSNHARAGSQVEGVDL
ncbi:hypothetical protein NVP1151O_21 [Vibrio phage 1.151.O._10N.222.46.B1]|nr:hypothetical protein NVP1151O_21 [Vibrio phage 1.151.O._10N.222.46.B1]